MHLSRSGLRETVEFSEDLNIQKTSNASLLLVGAALWSAANWGVPTLMERQTLSLTQPGPVITSSFSPEPKPLFASIEIFALIDEIFTQSFWDPECKVTEVQPASVALFGRMRSGGDEWWALCCIWLVLSTNRSQSMSHRKLTLNRTEEKRRKQFFFCIWCPHSCVCNMCRRVPLLNRLHRSLLNNMLLCCYVTSSIIKQPSWLFSSSCVVLFEGRIRSVVLLTRWIISPKRCLHFLHLLAGTEATHSKTPEDL